LEQWEVFVDENKKRHRILVLKLRDLRNDMDTPRFTELINTSELNARNIAKQIEYETYVVEKAKFILGVLA
jgi:hypothetical protein